VNGPGHVAAGVNVIFPDFRDSASGRNHTSWAASKGVEILFEQIQAENRKKGRK
jgi:hypothetical protein